MSHTGLRGTKRVGKYTLIHDDNGFDNDQLPEFTNALCYTYANCPRAIRYPTVSVLFTSFAKLLQQTDFPISLLLCPWHFSPSTTARRYCNGLRRPIAFAIQKIQHPIWLPLGRQQQIGECYQCIRSSLQLKVATILCTLLELSSSAHQAYARHVNTEIEEPQYLCYMLPRTRGYILLLFKSRARDRGNIKHSYSTLYMCGFEISTTFRDAHLICLQPADTSASFESGWSLVYESVPSWYRL